MTTDPDPAKPAIEVTTDSGAVKPANGAAVTTDSALPALTNQAAVPGLPRPKRSPSASACEAYREAIELGLGRGRNAMAIWQDLVSDYGFARSYTAAHNEQDIRALVVAYFS